MWRGREGGWGRGKGEGGGRKAALIPRCVIKPCGPIIPSRPLGLGITAALPPIQIVGDRGEGGREGGGDQI